MAAISDDSLDGTWHLVRAELNGETAHEIVIANTVLDMKAGRCAVRYTGERTDNGWFAFGEPTAERTIVSHGVEGLNIASTIPRFYKYAGGLLHMCLGPTGATPTWGVSSPGKQQYLATYRCVI